MTSPEGPIQKPESVHEDTGYGKPYDPTDMTTDQARQLRDQNLGGQDAARIANRADDVRAFDTSLGQPEGMHDVVKSTSVLQE